MLGALTTNCPRLLFILASEIVLSSLVSAQEFRTWRDTSGRFEVDAVLVERDHDSVKLRKRNGVVIDVPFSKLSQRDRDSIGAPAMSGNSAPGPVMLEDPTAAPPLPRSSAEPGNSDGSITPESFEEAFVRGMTEAVESVAETGGYQLTGLKVIKWCADQFPDEDKKLAAFFAFIIAGGALQVFALIWLLVHQFRANLGWGFAQLAATFMGCCIPFLSTLVVLIFGLSHLRESWAPFLLYMITLGLPFLGFTHLPSEIFASLDELPQP